MLDFPLWHKRLHQKPAVPIVQSLLRKEPQEAEALHFSAHDSDVHGAVSDAFEFRL